MNGNYEPVAENPEQIDNQEELAQQIVRESEELFTDYEGYHDEWAEQVQKNRDYVFNKQWTSDEVEELSKRNQAPLVINRIYPVIDQKLAIMAAKSPGIRVTGREDSDNKISKVIEDLMQYVWQQSDGDVIYMQALKDSLITGLGYIYCYVDKYADDGLGEVKFGYVDPDDVYVDPNSKDPLFRDAEAILIVKHLPRRQMKLRYPKMAEVIDAAYSEQEKVRGGSRHADEHQKVGREISYTTREKVRLIERYYKTTIEMVRYESPDGKMQVVTPQEFQQVTQMMAQAGQDVSILNPEKIYRQRVAVACSVSNKLLYHSILPVDEYPIVPLVNVHTGTPYAMGEPAFLLGQQDMINKLASLMIAHAQTSTNPKIFMEKGTVDDIDTFRESYTKPGIVLEYNPGTQPPIPVQPIPLPSALYGLSENMKYEIEYSSGIFALMQGSAADSPETFRGTLAIEEFGNRRVMMKLKTIERALSQLFKVALQMAQNLYTIKKTFRIVGPSGIESEQEINTMMYDDVTNTIKKINDISVGKYDVIVVAGSTMPSNRWALAEEYKQWYQMGLIDDIEVLKKLDIFDREGVIQRKSVMMQQRSQLEQMEAMLKELSEQLEDAKRREITLEKRLELADFTTKIEKILAQLEGKSDTLTAEMQYKLKEIVTEAKNAISQKKENPSKKE